MDTILKNTIRVTKCLLSYGVVQENVEKIILEAFGDEIERYPVLYEQNVHKEEGWLKTKNCSVCKITIGEISSSCEGCYKTVCRFCLKNNCCVSCNEFFNKKCIICQEVPSLPVLCFLENCKCKNLYCLTCLQGFKLNHCLKCKVEFIPPYKNIGRGNYGIPRYIAQFLDSKHGEILCPTKCGKKLSRTAAQSHLQHCPNAKNMF